MFERLGSLTYRLRFPIVVVWIVAAILCARLAPSLAGQGSTDQASFLPAGTPSVQARDALERAFPGSTSASSATLTFERASGLTDADRAYIDEVAARAASTDAPAELRDAVTSTETARSRPELAKMLQSDDGALELLIVNLDVETAGDAAAKVVSDLRAELNADSAGHPGLVTHVTGAAAISSDYLAAVRSGTDSTTLITVGLVIVVLLLIYRAPLAALVPLATIGGAFVVSRGVLGLLAAAGWHVSSLLDTFLVVMVFGVGTDYAIFLISRYREEVSGGGDWHEAARSTVKRIGAVISASAATVMVGMAAMAFGDFQMIQSTGPAIAVAIFVTLVAGLTLAPALLSIFGHYLFWPLHTRAAAEGEPGGFFARLAAAVSRRPGVVTVVLLIALLIPALYLPQVRTNFDVLAELPATADSRLGYDTIASHLGEDKLVQSTGLVSAGGGSDVLTPASLARLRDLMTQLKATTGVATVTSLVTPDGDGVVPDGFRPSAQLTTIGDKMKSDDGASGDSASLLGTSVSDGLDSAQSYVNGLASAYPDVAASTELRAVTGGLADAQSIIERVRTQAVLSTQLRTLAAAVTSPVSAAGGSSGTSPSLMRDYLAELAAAWPEVRSLPAFTDATKAATSLEHKATAGAAASLGTALESLAGHFDNRPDATLSPRSLAGTSAAKALKAEAKATFDALPAKFAALAAVFAARPDDIYIPTTLAGADGQKVQDAIDAFVSQDRTASRFYLTSSNDPYSGSAFSVVRQAQDVIKAAAPSFGANASGYLGGPTAQFSDVQQVLSNDFLRVGIITVIGILIVLMILLRSVVAPLYLAGTVLVSYASAVGLSAWFFQVVLGQPGISFYLPLMVFVLLVALGSDYNIFLMSRVREESETRPIRDGVRIASGHTGAVITSAGLILAGTFGSMATAPLAVLFQVGVAVAIGVLIDTFVVRSILVPAITTLVGDLAWWPSGWHVPATLRNVPATLAPGSGVLAGAALAGGPGAAGRTAFDGAAADEIGAAGSGFADRRRPSPGRLAVAIALVIVVPVVAAGLLTWSFGRTADTVTGQTVAIVNLDEGGSATAPDGSSTALQLGGDLATALTAAGADSDLRWETTSAADAASGLANGRYAATLTVPADFSRTIAAIRADAGGRAPRASLRLDGARAAGVPAAVARDVMTAVDATASRGVTAAYVGDILLALTDAHDQVADAATSAGSVADASTASGSDAQGLATIASGVASGLGTLADGAASAQAGTVTLVAGTKSLAAGIRRVADGAGTLSSGTTTAATGAGQLAGGARSLADGAAKLDTSLASLPGQTSQLASGAADLAAGSGKVSSGAANLAAGLDTLKAHTKGLGDQTADLDAGAAGVASGASDLRDGAKAADTAAGSLADGAKALRTSVQDYTDSVSTLASSCAALGGSDPLCAQLAAIAANGAALDGAAAGVSTGASQLAGSTGDLVTGATGVASGAAKVHAGTSDLAAAAPALESGVATSADGADQLATGAKAAASGATAVSAGTKALDASVPALVAGVRKLSTGANGVSDGAGSLASGLHDLASGASQLATGAAKAADGATAMASGAASAAGGAGQLGDALAQAADGARLVETSATNLADRQAAIGTDAGSLASRLREAADGIRSYAADTRTRMGDLAADPVVVEGATAGPTQDGLAALLLGLAAWLAALGAFLVLPVAWAVGGRRWWAGPIAAFAVAGTVAVAAALLAVLVVAGPVGVSVARMPELLLAAIVSALAFTALVQVLVTLFGTRGWLFALLLLVIGAAAAGMPVPVSSLPAPLAAIHPILPLTYAVDWLHAAITGTGSGSLDAFVLLAWLVVGLLGTLASVAGARQLPSPVPLPT